MNRVLLTSCISLFALACSEPKCLPNERKIGMQCRVLKDAASKDDDEPGQSGEQISDAATDAAIDARTFDSAVPADARAASVADGAIEPVSMVPVDVDAGTSAPPPVMMPPPVCGDGTLNGTELCDPAIAAGQPGACATSCSSNNKCVPATPVGKPSDCNVRCETESLSACKNDDGCCPAGCTKSNDNDCSASCRNGYVDVGETCEPGVGNGCLTSCPPPSGCTSYMLTGSADNCNAQCTEVKNTAFKAGDGCCNTEAGATPSNDADCVGCGNGKKEGAETCDGSDCKTSCADSDPCTADIPPTGMPSQCNVTCPTTGYPVKEPDPKDKLCCGSANATTDPDCPAKCDNKLVEPGETCDGNCPSCDDGNACTVDTQSGNAGTCNVVCTHSPLGPNHTTKDGCCPSGATAATDLDCAGCGNGIVESGEACDSSYIGCSQSSCQYYNNPNFPGDERPGYVRCGSDSTSCGPSVFCFESGFAPTTWTCGGSRGDRGYFCDGPEDCQAPYVCGTINTDFPTINCDHLSQFARSPPYHIFCHTKADCQPGEDCVAYSYSAVSGECKKL
jgi:hypothetical protein